MMYTLQVKFWNEVNGQEWVSCAVGGEVLSAFGRARKIPTTIACYRSDLASFFRIMGLSDEDSPVSCRVVADEISRYRDHFMTCVRAETANRKLSVLRSFLRWALATGRIDLHTIPEIRQIPAERRKARRVRLLSRAEQARLLKTVEDANEARAYALLTLMLHTGIRISEVRRLVWRDVRTEGAPGTICIRSSKSRREVILPLDAITADALCALREANRGTAETPVFPGRSGPLTRSQIVNVLGRYFAAAGIKDSKPEMLRLTFEANMIDSGTDPYTLAYLMGYSRLGFPQKRYSKINEVLQRDVISRERRRE